jgi:hypothetical protein
MPFEVPDPTVSDVVEVQEAFAARDRLIEKVKQRGKRQAHTRRPSR